MLLGDGWQPGSEVLALTEADAEQHPYSGVLDLEVIEDGTGLRHAETLVLPGLCQRGACIFDLERGGCEFLLIVTHLSLGQMLRIARLRIIRKYLHRRPEKPVILMGDLNEWRLWGGLAFTR